MMRMWIAVMVAMCGCLSACSTVAPYERERLARRDMQLQRSADAAAGEQHANAYREGATGAEGTSGGGCGCN
jgi:predicted component of type VI protein secretion system